MQKFFNSHRIGSAEDSIILHVLKARFARTFPPLLSELVDSKSWYSRIARKVSIISSELGVRSLSEPTVAIGNLQRTLTRVILRRH